MTNYIKYVLKKNLPFHIISFVLVGWSFIITALSNNFFVEERYASYSTDMHSNYPSSLFYIPVIVFMIMTLVIPFIAQSYRFRLASVDTYYQAPIKKGYLKYINSLCLYVPLVLSFTLLFFLGVLVIYMKATMAPLPEDVSTEYVDIMYSRVNFHYEYYFLGYFLALLISPCMFFFSSFIVSKTNNMLNAIFTFILVFVASMFVLGTITNFISLLANIGDITKYNRIEDLLGISPVYPVYTLCTWTEDAILYGTLNNFFMEGNKINAYELARSILYVSVIGYTVFDFFWFKEPSGEFAGKPIGKDFFQNFFIHFAFGTFLFSIGTTVTMNAVIGPISEVVFVIIGYYLILSWLRRNFKPRLMDIILMSGNISLFLVTFLGKLSILNYVTYY